MHGFVYKSLHPPGPFAKQSKCGGTQEQSYGSFSQKHLRCLGSRLGTLSRGSDTEVTKGWTEGKPWEIAWGSWGELRCEGTDGSNDWVDGGETVGNSLWRAPVGRSDTGVMTGCTEGKPCEIAWGELRWEGAIRKRQEGGQKGNRVK